MRQPSSIAGTARLTKLQFNAVNDGEDRRLVSLSEVCTCGTKSYYIVLYYIILYYIVLYCIILYCIIVYYIILYYIVLYYIIFYYIVLYFIIFYYVICLLLKVLQVIHHIVYIIYYTLRRPYCETSGESFVRQADHLFLKYRVTYVTGYFGDRKSVVQGKSVDLGGRRIIKKKKRIRYGVHRNTQT